MDGLIDLKQIARRTGKNYRTIQRWAKAGVLPKPVIVRPNHRRYWTSEQIEKWLMTLHDIGGQSG